MATHSNTDAPKALRILIIKKPAIGKYTNFFDLPRELRNMIYEYALVERPLWHRRHRPGCPYHDPLEASEEPVFRTTLVAYERNESIKQRFLGLPRFSKDTLTLDRVLQCRRLCQGRHGLVLLRTCKRIYREAKRLFWRKNVICFDDVELFLAACNELPKTIKGSIRRLSIAESGYEKWYSPDGERLADKLWMKVTSLGNLVELELPPRTLWLDARNLMSIQQLVAARALKFENVTVQTTSDAQAELIVLFSKDIPLPPCSRQGPTFCDGWDRKKRDYCGECSYDLWRAGRLVHEEIFGWNTMPNRARWVANSLQGKVPAYSGQALKGVRPFQPFEIKWDIGLLGLPLNSSNVRERMLVEKEHEEKKTMRANCSNARRMRKQEGTVSVCAIEEVDLDASPRTRKYKLDYGERYVGEERTTAEVVAERHEKLELEEKRASTNRSKAAKKSVERGVKELSLEKKAARRRSGRR